MTCLKHQNCLNKNIFWRSTTLWIESLNIIDRISCCVWSSENRFPLLSIFSVVSFKVLILEVWKSTISIIIPVAMNIEAFIIKHHDINNKTCFNNTNMHSKYILYAHHWYLQQKVCSRLVKFVCELCSLFFFFSFFFEMRNHVSAIKILQI